eukprot:TRINITY_DN21076_c0_g1_i2.p1 TRINITY_DN21076_c0_g1~~TRINITY_DN21076_c0_g1_i2.p1  ORF type:complete len:179 (-),score=63.93 TRINITY_DN21076_c0_g1_i2:122-658(-)
MGEDDAGPPELGAGSEMLLDPERARERQRIAKDAEIDFVGRLGNVDFAAARARVAAGREVDHDPNRPCLRGNPTERGGVMSRHDFMIEKARREAEEAKRLSEERLRDPKTRHEELAKRAEEQAQKDKLAFAKEAEERALRLESKKRQLASEKPASKVAKKAARLSFDEDPDAESDEDE